MGSHAFFILGFSFHKDRCFIDRRNSKKKRIEVIEAYGEKYWTNKNGISYGEKTGMVGHEIESMFAIFKKIWYNMGAIESTLKGGRLIS
jgi:hypothetical protein